MEDDIDGFDCGLPVVNNWLRNQLKNAGRQHTAVAYATFSNGVLAGFYTLSAYGINHTEANGWLKRNSPDPIPAILLGMLGVDIRYQTMHIGSQLLRDATLRASNAAEIVGARHYSSNQLPIRRQNSTSITGFDISNVQRKCFFR